jgi:predicted porin
MKLRKFLPAGCCAAAVAMMAIAAVPASARADTTEDLLKQLRSKGVLTKKEYDTLSKRRQAEAAAETAQIKKEAEAAVAKTQPPAGDSTYVRVADKGLGIKVGQVNIGLSGSVNGFYVHESGDNSANNTVVGGLASTGNKTSAVRNGLLPGFLKIDVTTKQGEFDVGAHFGIYPGINSVSWTNGANSGGSPQALSTSGADFRQTYLTVAHASVGEFKVGRDIGMFGSDAILNDMSLLGVGTAAANSSPSNTSLGRIGVGYIYTDFQPQISFTSVKFNGFSVGAGVFQPLTTIGTSEVNSTPGFQGKLTYDFTASGLTGHLWTGVISQKHDATGTQRAYTGTGYEIGAKLGYGPVGLLGYAYKGEGIGTTGLFILSATSTGSKRDSSGYYIQGTVTPIEKLTLGVSYGESRLDLANGEVNPTLVKKNSSWIGQVKYGLTPWVNLIGEYTSTRAKAHGGNEADSDAVALGAIMLF